MFIESLFEFLGAIGTISWFVWPFTFVFGLVGAVFYLHPTDEEDEAGRDGRERRAIGNALIAGVSLLMLFCTALYYLDVM